MERSLVKGGSGETPPGLDTRQAVPVPDWRSRFPGLRHAGVLGAAGLESAMDIAKSIRA